MTGNLWVVARTTTTDMTMPVGEEEGKMTWTSVTACMTDTTTKVLAEEVMISEVGQMEEVTTAGTTTIMMIDIMMDGEDTTMMVRISLDFSSR